MEAYFITLFGITRWIHGIVAYSDVSGKGLDCVLMMHSGVIAYASWQLRPHEMNYPFHDLEFAAAMFIVKIWRHYLLNDRMDIYMDNMSLVYVFSHMELNMSKRS